MTKSRAKLPQLAAFAANVRRERVARGMTQEKLAELMEVNSRTIQKIEAGKLNILLTTVLRLQKALNCSWDSLMKRSNIGQAARATFTTAPPSEKNRQVCGGLPTRRYEAGESFAVPARSSAPQTPLFRNCFQLMNGACCQLAWVLISTELSPSPSARAVNLMAPEVRLDLRIARQRPSNVVR